MMRALAHSGNYVVGAFRGERLIGARSGSSAPTTCTRTSPAWTRRRQSRGVGYAIKLHQRAWALDRRIESVRWTFDPLVRRNAYFNLHKLGARAVTYLPDFYGPMTDGINAGDATATGSTSSGTSPRRRPSRPRPATRARSTAGGVAADAEVVLGRDDAAAPAPAKPVYDGRPLLVAVPADVEALRGRDPRWPYGLAGRGRARRSAARSSAGYRITGMARDGWYVMEARKA